jgi:hypothetical protein
MFDEILAYKFDNFIGGHLTDTGTRKDVELTREYTNDVYQTVKRIHNGLNERAFDAEIAKTIGPDNEFLIFVDGISGTRILRSIKRLRSQAFSSRRRLTSATDASRFGNSLSVLFKSGPYPYASLLSK